MSETYWRCKRCGVTSNMHLCRNMDCPLEDQDLKPVEVHPLGTGKELRRLRRAVLLLAVNIHLWRAVSNTYCVEHRGIALEHAMASARLRARAEGVKG